MSGMTDAYEWSDRTMLDRQGEEIGKIKHLYRDKATDRPEWALVHTGLFGTKSSFVPVADAEPKGEDVQVPIDKETVKHAPRVEVGEELSPEEEERLYEHYR